VTPQTAINAEHANHYINQVQIEDLASDQELFVTVFNNNLLMDTHVLHVKQDMSQLVIEANVSQLQLAKVQHNILDLLMHRAATNADTVPYHRFQLQIEEDATDLFQPVIVSNNTHQMDIHALTAKLDMLLPTTTETVSQPHLALSDKNIVELVILITVTDADNVSSHKSQLLIEVDAIDQKNNADVLKCTRQMDMNVKSAQQDKLLPSRTQDVSQLQLVSEISNTSVTIRTATNADNVSPHKSQLPIEEDAIDLFQSVTAFNNTQLMDMNA
jgi:hypothetical protein